MGCAPRSSPASVAALAYNLDIVRCGRNVEHHVIAPRVRWYHLVHHSICTMSCGCGTWLGNCQLSRHGGPIGRVEPVTAQSWDVRQCDADERGSRAPDVNDPFRVTRETVHPAARPLCGDECIVLREGPERGATPKCRQMVNIVKTTRRVLPDDIPGHVAVVPHGASARHVDVPQRHAHRSQVGVGLVAVPALVVRPRAAELMVSARHMAHERGHADHRAEVRRSCSSATHLASLVAPPAARAGTPPHRPRLVQKLCHQHGRGRVVGTSLADERVPGGRDRAPAGRPVRIVLLNGEHVAKCRRVVPHASVRGAGGGGRGAQAAERAGPVGGDDAPVGVHGVHQLHALHGVGLAHAVRPRLLGDVQHHVRKGTEPATVRAEAMQFCRRLLQTLGTLTDVHPPGDTHGNTAFAGAPHRQHTTTQHIVPGIRATPPRTVPCNSASTNRRPGSFARATARPCCRHTA
eukprot:m.835078 g.835078  ORF g.835078 m.835078 type:complete len:463 (-) comp23452_c0_seq16:1965-3353(-)